MVDTCDFAELVVQGLIDELRGHAEARCGSPVVVQKHLHAAVLLIGGDIFDLRHLQHFFVDQRSPGCEVAHRIGRDLVLVLGVALSSPDANVLRSLQKGGSSSQCGKFGAESIDHHTGGDAGALRPRLEGHKDESGVAGPTASGKALDCLNGRILLDDPFGVEQGSSHG